MPLSKYTTFHCCVHPEISDLTFNFESREFIEVESMYLGETQIANLDRDQIESLHQQLGEWLEGAPCPKS